MTIEHLSVIAVPYRRRFRIGADPLHELQRELNVATLEGRKCEFVQNYCFRLDGARGWARLFHLHFSTTSHGCRINCLTFIGLASQRGIYLMLQLSLL